MGSLVLARYIVCGQGQGVDSGGGRVAAGQYEIYGNRDEHLPPTDLYTWDTRLERVLSQTVSVIAPYLLLQGT